MPPSIESLLQLTIEKKASDLHLKEGSSPIFRINGDVHFSDLNVLSARDMESCVQQLTNDFQKRRFKEQNHVEFSYDKLETSRFRINIFKQLRGLEITVRLTPWEVPSIEELRLPAILKSLAMKPNGLVLVSGPAGSGKSTTLASMVSFINANKKGHIITIEDPIEFVHKDNLCSVTQQEVGQHVASFSSALRSNLRMDPNVLVVGEMRDLDTISNAVTAAETGHLVLATVHANDSVQAIDRLIDVFPARMQFQIRTQLVASLQGVIYQVLLRKKDGSGMVPACETLMTNSAVRNLIKEDKSQQIYNVIQTNREYGMQLLDDSLKELYQQGVISAEEALGRARDVKYAERVIH